MNSFANYIHKKFRKGCQEVLESAIKLRMSFEDILYILYCFNQAFKAPFLDQEEYCLHARTRPIGDLMEELFVARDIIDRKMSRELRELEAHLSAWREDAGNNNAVN
ncbi:MAG: hypothetical protein ACOYEC_06090 [Christensenellales bacterium]|jgi:hypothetical protein|nr:hypothetical protein [Clostridiales bacterium]